MKVLVWFLIVTAFLSISIFGFSILHEEMHAMNCLASTLGGGVCSPNSDGFGFASFHLNAFKIFSSATFELALIVFALLTGLGLILFFNGGEPEIFERARLIPQKVSGTQNGFRLAQWLSLLEKRDPAPSF